MSYDIDTGEAITDYDPTTDEDYIPDTGEIIETSVETDADTTLPDPTPKQSTIFGVYITVYTWSSMFKPFIAHVTISRDVVSADGSIRMTNHNYSHLSEASLNRAYRMQARVLEITRERCRQAKIEYEQSRKNCIYGDHNG